MAELYDLLERDHARLDGLLDAALRPDGTIDRESYGEFRAGLLRHIAIEERLLLPLVRGRGEESELERQLHRDHAALAALLVPPPTDLEIRTIRSILESHNPLEEGPGTFYEHVEALAAEGLPDLVRRIRDYPPVPLAPHADSAVTRSSIEQLLRQAKEGRKRLRS